MRLPDLSAIFRKNWKVMVSDDQRILTVFPKPPMICFTRGGNQKEELCRAKLPPLRMVLRGVVRVTVDCVHSLERQ